MIIRKITAFALTGLILIALSALVAAQDSGVRAEALQQANVRSGPGIDYPQIGSIRAGAQYPVIGRHELYPWLLIEFGDPVQPGWVFADLLRVTGDLGAVPLRPADYIDTIYDAPLAVTVTPTGTPTPDALPGGVSEASPAEIMQTPNAQPAAQPTAAPTQPQTGVIARPIDSANLRCGPGTDYPRVGTIFKDEAFAVLQRHAGYPWLQISFPAYQTGVAWVYQDLVEIEGDINLVPATANPVIDCPLTPTPPAVVPAQSRWEGLLPAGDGDPGTPVDMAQLGDDVMEFLYSQNYIPRTEKLASAFGYDLQTGQGFSLYPGVAFSGMSLIKVPLLVTYFRHLNMPPTTDQAYWITGMMTCSNNPSSNAILKDMGGGNPYVGAERVTETMRELGLQHTFLQAPLVEDPEFAQNQNVTPIVTTADQASTNPDPFNQTTMEDIGWLLVALYECGQHGRGPLLEKIDGITQTECRRILYALDENYLGAMIEAGVPDDVTVAHKHGWTTDEDHADAAIVFSPGGNYVLAIAMHKHRRLDYQDAWINIAEISRLVYNTFNPGAPLDAIHPRTVPEECELEGHPLLIALTQEELPMLE
ncbi:MAG: SH3 domain-containing protein [Anaerolineae bacterium]|nr:SH3 domain-containing protein [Anaerolineae bacterium]